MAGKKIAIIGAGLGGLAAAIRLAGYGAQVDVYERNPSAGGKAGELRSDVFRFDMGPTLLTMPFVLEELIDAAGNIPGSRLALTSLRILCRYFYPDGTVIDATSDPESFAAEIEKKTGDTADSILSFLAYSKKIYDLTSDLFLFSSFDIREKLLNRKALSTLMQIRRIDPFRSMHKANASYFTDPRTIQLFDRYATYNGSSPFKAPATLNIIPHVEYSLGGYVPADGMYSIPCRLRKLAETAGAVFHFNTSVDRILHRNGRIAGIEIDGVKEEYHIVVSNADVLTTYERLLDDRHSRSAGKYRRLEPSSSALVFYWGIDGEFPDVKTHNVFFSENYRAEFGALFDSETVYTDPTIYIYVSGKYSPSDAPAGYENWYVMINVPGGSQIDWNRRTGFLRDRIISKIERVLGIRLSDRIVFERILTPRTIERISGSLSGSLYGISSNSRRSAFLRQANRSREYRGLYFCGGSAHPGGGIPLVLLSGKITAELIRKYELTGNAR